MIGCPSHRALLGLMVFRPGMGGRWEQRGGGGEVLGVSGMDREKVFCSDQFVPFVRVGFCRPLLPERRKSTPGPERQPLHSAVPLLTSCLLSLPHGDAALSNSIIVNVSHCLNIQI